MSAEKASSSQATRHGVQARYLFMHRWPVVQSTPVAELFHSAIPVRPVIGMRGNALVVEDDRGDNGNRVFATEPTRSMRAANATESHALGAAEGLPANVTIATVVDEPAGGDVNTDDRIRRRSTAARPGKDYLADRNGANGQIS